MELRKMEKVIKKKLVMAGDLSVGKTSLIRRFTIDQFDDKYLSTLGTKISKKTIQYGNINLNCQIWDISGQPELRNIQERGFKGGHGAFVVCDLSNPDSIASVRYWVALLNKIVPNIPFIIAGNKSDLVAPDCKEIADLRALSWLYGVEPLITSAKTGCGVEDAFTQLGSEVLSFKPSASTREVRDIDLNREHKSNPYLEVEDKIVVKFCEAINDLNMGMSIVRKQFENANIDFRHASKPNLVQVVNKLVQAGGLVMDKKHLEEFRSYSLNLISRL